jgi:hypothetical protein
MKSSEPVLVENGEKVYRPLVTKRIDEKCRSKTNNTIAI